MVNRFWGLFIAGNIGGLILTLEGYVNDQHIIFGIVGIIGLIGLWTTLLLAMIGIFDRTFSKSSGDDSE